MKESDLYEGVYTMDYWNKLFDDLNLEIVYFQDKSKEWRNYIVNKMSQKQPNNIQIHLIFCALTKHKRLPQYTKCKNGIILKVNKIKWILTKC